VQIPYQISPWKARQAAGEVKFAFVLPHKFCLSCHAWLKGLIWEDAEGPDLVMLDEK
jgi:hypothetical protein